MSARARLQHWWRRHFGAFEVHDERTGERTLWRWEGIVNEPTTDQPRVAQPIEGKP